MINFPTGCLGKLPLHGDFIRFNASAPEVKELDLWVQEGIVSAYEELDGKWSSTFDIAPVQNFVYCSPHTGKVVAGVLKPSVDKAGRRYPFMVYGLLDPTALANDVGYLPIALGDFISKAEDMSEWSANAINLSSFLASFESLKFQVDMGSARGTFAKFVLTRTSADYWTGLYGDAGDARKLAMLDFVSSGSDLHLPQTVAARLPQGDTAAEASFWFELSRRLSSKGTLPTWMAWNTSQGEFPSRLHICYGDLKPAYFLPFVLPNWSSNVLRDLSQPGTIAPSKAVAGFVETLNEGSLKLSDLLQRLPRCKEG